MQSSTRPCVVSLALTMMLGIAACSSDTPATPCGSYARSDLLWDVAYGAAGFVAVGMGGTALVSQDGDSWTAGDGGIILHSPDGESWTPEPSPTDEELFALAAGTNGVVAVAGVDTILFSADGHTWSVNAAGD